MIWNKPIHTVPPEERLIPGGNFPAGIKNFRPSGNTFDTTGRVLVFNDTQEMGDILYTMAPFIDSAYCVSAVEISQRQRRAEWVDIFEGPLDRALKVADLLFVVNVDMADEKDLKYLRFVIATRASHRKITAVDSDTGLAPHRKEE